MVKNVDGLAVVAPSTLEKDDSLTKTLHTVQDNGVPLVLLDRAVYSIFSDFVTTDNKYGGRAAAEKLVQAGAKQIGCILGPAQVYTTKSAIRVFRKVLPSSRHITGNRMFFTEALPRNLGAPRLKRCMHRAAMAFCGNDRMAKGVLAAAKEKGIHIGENCKFAVYDYEGTENVISVRQNLSLMAEKAVDRLIERIEEPEKLMPAGNFYITPLVEN